MKKILILPLFAMAALVSQAWAGVCTESGGSFCQFDTGCFEISTEYSDIKNTCTKGNCTCPQLLENCKKWGSLYSGVTGLTEANGWGENVKCANNGGTFVAGNDPNRTALGCCKWDKETTCYTIWSGTNDEGKTGEQQVSDCNGGSNRFWSGQCPTSGCPSGKPDYDGEDPADGYCCYEANSYNNYEGYCGPINATLTLSECQSNSGQQVSSCGGCQTTPTIKFTPASQALIVAPYGRSLHISSAKDATVSLYDMSGAKVYSGKVRAGNSVFGLEKVASGSYYAIVQSGSDSKKVSVILK